MGMQMRKRRLSVDVGQAEKRLYYGATRTMQ